MFNKNGLPVGGKPEQIMEELNRGTGSIMAEKAAIFMAAEGINEKYIVVARAESGESFPDTNRFHSSRSQEAVDLFLKWRDGSRAG